MYRRDLLDNLKKKCFQKKVILLLGARQVGKTSLLKELVKEMNAETIWLNADEGDVYNELTKADTSTKLFQVIGNAKLVIIDEAQQIPDIGKKLKLIYDNKPEIQVIATGSSSFDLMNEANEPLTGRKRVFHLYPITFKERVANSNILEAKRNLENHLIYGSYPEVVNNFGNEKEALLEIANSYLYKDILRVDGIKKSSHLEKLLQAIAFQVGNEVSYNELANTIGNIDTATVEKYLNLLEKTFVIFKLPAFNRNLRNEIKKGKKYYFFDNGIRNILISNFTSIDMRFDKGALWENFLVAERMKVNAYNHNTPNTYFWRTHDQAEIDYIEEQDGYFDIYEFKWKEKKRKFPASFLNTYNVRKQEIIHKENFDNFVDI